MMLQTTLEVVIKYQVHNRDKTVNYHADNLLLFDQ